MLNIGPGELIMICVIALIVLGPDKLPQAMRTAGQVMSQLRRLSNGFQQDFVQSFIDETVNDRPGKELNRRGGNGTSSDVDTETEPEDASSDDEVSDAVTAEGHDQDADGNPRVA